MEEKQGKKIIVVGNKEKVSPQLLENIKEHYGCEVEIVSKEEYRARALNDFAEGIVDNLHQVLTVELRKLQYDDPLLFKKEKIKQEFPKKIGAVHAKKAFSKVKQYRNQKRGR